METAFRHICQRAFTHVIHRTIKTSSSLQTKTLQYLSDIHLEYLNKLPVIQKTGSNLALCGDIGNPHQRIYKDFLEKQAGQYEHVFLVAGNHEFWDFDKKKTMADIKCQINDVVSGLPNVHYLDDSVFQLSDSWTIIGSTLWSNVKVPLANNYSRIGDDLFIRSGKGHLFDPIISNQLHEKSVDFLTKELERNRDKKVVVLTHHLPSPKLIVDRYRTEKYNWCHDRFATDLEHLIQLPVRYWICGHSHCVTEIKINGVTCAINAYGYQKERVKDEYMRNNKNVVTLE